MLVKHNVEKRFHSKLVLFFTRLFRGGKSQAYKIQPVLFLFILCFLAATIFFSKLMRNNNTGYIYIIIFYKLHYKLQIYHIIGRSELEVSYW